MVGCMHVPIVWTGIARVAAVVSIGREAPVVGDARVGLTTSVVAWLCMLCTLYVVYVVHGSYVQYSR